MAMLTVHTVAGVTTITMNRPEVRNAFNATLIAELTDAFRAPPTRIMVLAGAGPVFSAGGDLAWMKASAELGHEGNVNESKTLATMFQTIDESEAIVVGRVHGAAFGGGMGLVSVCDCVVAEAKTRFAFTEVKLGLVPAVISPFCVRKIGSSAARFYFATGARFDAHEAQRLGLVHRVAPAEALDQTVETVVEQLLEAGPNALLESKRLVRDIDGLSREEAIESTAHTIARLRTSDEGQEGTKAFLEKRKPNWRTVPS